MQYTYTFLAKDLLSSKLNKIASNTSSKLSEVSQKNNQFNKGLDHTKKKSEETTKSLGGFNSILKKIGVAFGAMTIFNKTKDIALMGAEMESTRVSFETMLGSAEKANRVLAGLNEFSNVTPFQNSEVIQAGRNLIAFGTEAEDLQPTLKNLGDVAAGLNIPFTELAEIYGKNKVQGKLMTQDLNQMAGRGIPIFGELAKVMGVAQGEIRDLASKGQIDFKHLEIAFQNMAGQGGMFFNMMQKQSETFSGKWSTLMGKIQVSSIGLGEKILPKLKPILDWAINLVDKLPAIATKVQEITAPAVEGFVLIYDSVKDFIGALYQGSDAIDFFGTTTEIVSGIINFFANGISSIIKFLTPLAPLIKFIAIGYGIWTAAQWALNVAMSANPIGLIIIGIVALISAVKYAWDNFESFRGGIMATWEAIKGFAGLIKDVVIARITELIEGVTGIGSALWKLMKGDFKGALAEGKKATENMLGINSAQVAVKKAMELGKNTASAYRKGVDQVKQKNKLKEIQESATGGFGGSEEAIKSEGGNALTGDSMTEGINAITGGGSRQTNITLNFDRLNENINITTQNFREGVSLAEDQLKEMLLRVLNSANQLKTS